MLIDVYDRIGLAGMAQVDLGTRQNRHQPLASLTRMSSVVLRTVAARAGLARALGGDGIDGSEPGLWELRQPDTYLHAVGTADGARLDELVQVLIERPPLLTTMP
jgi:glucosyl-3-phosphoglycerate synthase